MCNVFVNCTKRYPSEVRHDISDLAKHKTYTKGTGGKKKPLRDLLRPSVCILKKIILGEL